LPDSLRVVLIGSPADRARLRTLLAGAAIEVVGEAPTIAAARAASDSADAFLLAPTPNEPAGRPSDDVEQEPLSRRELEVLELLALGLPNKAIAARLDISDQTVKSHVASICGKLGAANRTEAVRLAVRHGLITL
jgi:DNA-binding NarL/FixJ family response regulator